MATCLPCGDGRDVQNRTRGRKASANSFFWLAPDRILLIEYVGGGSAISELNLSDNSTRTLWKGPEGIHAFGNFPDFSISKAGNIAAAELSTYNSPPEIFAGPPGQWHQLTNNNVTLRANWGKAESVEWTNEGFTVQGLVGPAGETRSWQEISMVMLIHGGPSSVTTSEWPASWRSRAIVAASGAVITFCFRTRVEVAGREKSSRAQT